MLQNLAVEYEKLGSQRLPTYSRKVGYLVETSCTIIDLKGVGLSNVSSVNSYVKQVTAMSQNYYPERLGRLFLISAPWGFSTVFGIIQSWINPVTVEKIHVLGGNYQNGLLAQVPAENLPKRFGGTCECPGGCALSDERPWQDAVFVRQSFQWRLPIRRELVLALRMGPRSQQLFSMAATRSTRMQISVE